MIDEVEGRRYRRSAGILPAIARRGCIGWETEKVDHGDELPVKQDYSQAFSFVYRSAQGISRLPGQWPEVLSCLRQVGVLNGEADQECGDTGDLEPVAEDLLRSLRHGGSTECRVQNPYGARGGEFDPGRGGGSGRGGVRDSLASSLGPEVACVARSLTPRMDKYGQCMLARGGGGAMVDANYARYWLGRGWVDLDCSEYEQAIKDFTSAIEIDAGLAQAWSGRGVARWHVDDLPQAFADLTRAIELDPNVASVWESRGMAQMGEGDLDRAIADFSRALEINPEDTWAQSELAATYDLPKNQWT